MKNQLARYILVFPLAVLTAVAMDWVNPLLFSNTSIVSLAEAKDNDKDKDDDKDKDKDKNKDDEANCKATTGICSNRGTVTVIGMKSDINVRSGSGSVLLEVTSDKVDLESKSGDLTGRGLTKTGDFITRIGNVRVKYCVKPQDIGNATLNVQILDNAPGLDADGDPNSSDADIQFLKGSTMKIQIQNDPAKFKSDFSNCPGCSFKVKGKVLLGNLFISEFNPPSTGPTCPF